MRRFTRLRYADTSATIAAIRCHCYVMLLPAIACRLRCFADVIIAAYCLPMPLLLFAATLRATLPLLRRCMPPLIAAAADMSPPAFRRRRHAFFHAHTTQYREDAADADTDYAMPRQYSTLPHIRGIVYHAALLLPLTFRLMPCAILWLICCAPRWRAAPLQITFQDYAA